MLTPKDYVDNVHTNYCVFACAAEDTPLAPARPVGERARWNELPRRSLTSTGGMRRHDFGATRPLGETGDTTGETRRPAGMVTVHGLFSLLVGPGRRAGWTSGAFGQPETPGG